MTGTQTATTVISTVSIRKDIFDSPNLDIYSQMTYIVLSLYTNNHSQSLPTIQELARKGRMTKKQVSHSLQSLVDLKMLPHKVFREIIGDFGDDRLSWSAKGLLAYYKNNPNTDLKEVYELSGQSNDNEHSIQTAIQELKRFGYLDEQAALNKSYDISTIVKESVNKYTVPAASGETGK